MNNGLQGAVPGLIKVGSSAASPTSSQHSPVSARPGPSRKRGSDAVFGDQSPDSAEGWEDKDESRIGVKRACNECRQQKLRCDVNQDPFVACSRCQRCQLECRIDSNFKRVGKRKRNAEMEREIAELRSQLANTQQTSSINNHSIASTQGMPVASYSQPVPAMASPLDQYMGSHEAVASLLDLKSGAEGYMKSPGGKMSKRIDDVILTADQIDELFNVFFSYYNPFQPLLDPSKSPDEYYEASQLLFWTVISVAVRHDSPVPNIFRSLAPALTKLFWATIADVPQSYHVVKALCILCVWPLPISSTSADPTFMIAGLMMQISMQIGLHRPSHAQDFSKFKVELREEGMRDRVKTWAACNVIAQRVATGYGQPPPTVYDWTLAPAGMRESGFKLPDEMDARLRIEIFSDKVTKALYSNPSDPVGLAVHEQKSMLVNLLTRDLEELEQSVKSDMPAVNSLYIRAAKLHFRLSVFFDPPTTKTYQSDLMELWFATTSFLEQAFDIHTSTTNKSLTEYVTNYILQMIIASAFSLLKLLNSFFAQFVDMEYGRNLFARTIHTIRLISTVPNDLPSRLAEVLAQLWRAGGAGLKSGAQWTADNSLQLKVRCRMSMSLVFDSVWRWREEFQAKGQDNLESAVKNPTNPESATASSSASVTTSAAAPASLGPDGQNMQPKALDAMLAPPSSGISRAETPGAGDYGEWSNDVFDPLNWMLDGLVDFPSYGMVPGAMGPGT